MTKKLLIVILVISAYLTSSAQFNPQLAQKSLVKVMVKANDKVSICSGFIWKEKDWIVTSLHAMKPDGVIQVQYMDKNWCFAKIIRINIAADLVLLQITEGNIPPEVIPLKAYSTMKLNRGDEIVALGYNSGSKGSSTRSMKKGWAPSETLENLVPLKDRAAIKASGLPDLNLSIIYLEGSLLPGYSGSPVYNENDSLVGIGNGGLEGGASNVSWIIPAKFLEDLENSSQTSLPANFSTIAQHFSAEVEVSVTSENPDVIEEVFADEYQSFEGGDFLFYYTKTRTLVEMYNTSYDPENIDKIIDEFESSNLHVDYSVMSFDIYEDANSGIVVAIPEGQTFVYDDANDIFITDMTGYPQGYYYSLSFEGIKGDFTYETIENTANILMENLNNSLGAATNGFYLDQEYSYTTQLDQNSKIAYIMLIGNNQFINADNIAVASILYITLLQDKSQAFYSMANLIVPVDALNYAMNTGIDCVDNYDDSAEYCDYFESYMEIMCAAHLTTFANKQGYTQR